MDPINHSFDNIIFSHWPDPIAFGNLAKWQRSQPIKHCQLVGR